jgi:glycosyltransferase involved in cell wall biosynthesis
LKLLWHSNAPWSPTGYGQQTALFAPLLADRYEMALSANYGLDGSPIKWEGVPVLPGLSGDWGNAYLPQHAERFFGSRRGGLVITLCDVWPLDPEMTRSMNVASWCPVDHVPAPPKILEFLLRSEAVPIAMSRFGERALGRLDPLYVPHAVDTRTFKPQNVETVREHSFPPGAFVVGMVAANKGRPSRKSFSQALTAFARLAAQHENAYLYLHTVLDPNHSAGENLGELISALGIDDSRVRTADQYTLVYNPYSAQDMAKIYSAMDVLLNPSYGEGFGIPIIEAQACGVPVIVTDITSMPELVGAGWTVGHQPYWTALGAWQAVPEIDDIHGALEECYKLSPSRRLKLATEARRFAMRYDVRRVWKQHWLPTLRIVEQRFAARAPIRIPARKAAA